MPEQGWLQGCFIYYQITGRLLVYDTKETSRNITEYAVFVCPDCKKKLNTDNKLHKEYKLKCQEYIDMNGI